MGRKAIAINPKKGERLRQLLQEYNVSQKEIAAVLNYSPEQISYIINSKRNLTEPAAKEIIKYFNSINVNEAKRRASIIKKEMLEGKTKNFAWQSNIPEPETIRFEWLMGYDNFKTTKEYGWFIRAKKADSWARSWSETLTVQSKSEDTADRAFDLFLCMYGKRGTELVLDYHTESTWLYEYLSVEECYRSSNISKLYDKFRNELKDEYGKEVEIEDVPVFLPILDMDNSGSQIPCLAEDYIAAVNKVSDYARLVINDLINTSKEKAKEREKAKRAEEEKKELEEMEKKWEEEEHDG